MSPELLVAMGVGMLLAFVEVVLIRPVRKRRRSDS